MAPLSEAELDRGNCWFVIAARGSHRRWAKRSDLHFARKYISHSGGRAFTGFADASKTPIEIEEITLDELEEVDAAEEAWKAASLALADYKSAKLWGALTR